MLSARSADSIAEFMRDDAAAKAHEVVERIGEKQAECARAHNRLWPPPTPLATLGVAVPVGRRSDGWPTGAHPPLSAASR